MKIAENIYSNQQGEPEQIELEAPLFGWNATDGDKGICPKGMRLKREDHCVGLLLMHFRCTSKRAVLCCFSFGSHYHPFIFSDALFIKQNP
jgi:hypothetical protein